MDIKSTPLPVKKALHKLGNDIKDARKRRRIPMQLAADRASISRATLSKIEKGEEGVAIVAYVKILFVLGMIERVTQLADAAHDNLGLLLESEALPQRIRLSSKGWSS